MFKKLAIASVLGTAMLGGPGFAAESVTGNFDVKITLTPKCVIDTSGTEIAATYVAYGDAIQASDSFNVKCTSGAVYSLSLDGNGSYKDASTELNYTTKLGATSGGGTVGSSVDGTGNGSDKTYYVTVNIGANQSGGIPSGQVTLNNTRTITVAY